MMKTRIAPVRFVALALGAAALAALQGCSTPSRGIADDGTAVHVVFPDRRQDAWQKEGTFPTADNLRAVAPGLSKDQLYALLGRPHFNEGLFGVREWDYVFHFRKPGGAVATCQFKVLFDKDYRAQRFHWLPADCEGAPAQGAGRRHGG